jgi:hypothetical protein
MNSGLISMLDLHYVQISKVQQGEKYLYEIVARGTCHDKEDGQLGYTLDWADCEYIGNH